MRVSAAFLRSFVTFAIVIPLLLLGCHRAQIEDAPAFPVFDVAQCDTAAASTQSEDGMITTVAPGPNGVLAWSGGIRATAIHLDANGHDTILGREGAGPDEFASIGPAWWVGDTLWVSDYRQGRSVAHTLDGQYVATLTPPLPGVWVRTATGRSVGIAPISAANPKVVMLAFADGQRLDTLGEFAAPDTFHAGDDPRNPGPFTMRLVIPAWNPDASRWCAITSGKGSDIHIECLSPAGDRELDTTVVLPPRAVTTRDYDLALAPMLKGLDPAHAARVRAETPKPPLFAPAFGALLDDQNRFWIRRSSLGERTEIWSLLTPRGVPIRSMTLPAEMTLRAVRDDLLYLRAEQGDGFQTLLRCHL